VNDVNIPTKRQKGLNFQISVVSQNSMTNILFCLHSIYNVFWYDDKYGWFRTLYKVSLQMDIFIINLYVWIKVYVLKFVIVNNLIVYYFKFIIK
jgi:hypothetical protein